MTAGGILLCKELSGICKMMIFTDYLKYIEYYNIITEFSAK